MKDPAVLSRFFSRFFDFKTCFQVGARGGYHKHIIFQFTSEGRGFKKWEPLVIYLYNRSDNQQKTDAVSKKHPTLVFNPPDQVPAQHWWWLRKNQM
jgi:hypothetical protein